MLKLIQECYYANGGNAYRFYRGLIEKLAGNTGTPLHPGYIEVTCLVL